MYAITTLYRRGADRSTERDCINGKEALYYPADNPAAMSAGNCPATGSKIMSIFLTRTEVFTLFLPINAI